MPDLFPLQFRCSLPGARAPFSFRLEPAQILPILEDLGWSAPPFSPETLLSLSLALSEAARELSERALWSCGLEAPAFNRSLPEPLASRGWRGARLPAEGAPSPPLPSGELSLASEARPSSLGSRRAGPARGAAKRARAALEEAFSCFAPRALRPPLPPDSSLANGLCLQLASGDERLLAAFSPAAAASLLALPCAYRSDTLGAALCLLPALCERQASGRSWTLYPMRGSSSIPDPAPFPRIGLSLLSDEPAPLEAILLPIERFAGEPPLWTRRWSNSSDFGWPEEDQAHLAAWEALRLESSPPPPGPSRPKRSL